MNRILTQKISKQLFSQCCRFSLTARNHVMPGDQSEIKGDGAIRRTKPTGSTLENTYAGALSFLRRNYTRDLTDVDVAVTGIPLDLATTYRPGARFGPKGIREASVQVARRKSYPDGLDLFEELAVIDYGDCYLEPGRPETIPESIINHAREIINKNVFMLSLGETFKFCY